MRKMLRLFLCFLCLTLVSSTFVNFKASAEQKTVDEYSYNDEAGNSFRIVREVDGTIVVYKNGILDHSAKSDIAEDKLVVTYYNNQKDLTTRRALPETEVYKISELVDKFPVASDIEGEKNNQPLAYDSQFPYSSGYSFKESYYDSGVTNLTVEGYTKPDGTSFTSEQKVSFLRSMTIGTAASLVFAVMSGPISLPVVVAAISASAVGLLADGIFTRNVDVYVNYEIRWSKWLGFIRSKNFEYYTTQGTYYLRTVNRTADIVDKRIIDTMPPAGWVYSFNDFLRTTISQYTNK